VLGYGFSGVIGGVLGGIISDKYGLASVFIACTATSLIAVFCAYKVWKHHKLTQFSLS
jgi:PPP family 3-phenylpropionic acid transporter